MSRIERILHTIFPSMRPAPPSGTTVYEVVRDAGALDRRDTLPAELRVVLTTHPDVAPDLRAMLDGGVGLGVRSTGRSSQKFLDAVRTIAVHTQHRLIAPWLRPLLLNDVEPTFTATDRAQAAADNIDLDAHVRALREVRAELKVFVVIDDRGRSASAVNAALIDRLNGALAPAAIEYAVNRIEFDNANERTEVAQAIIKAMLFIGPIAHIFEEIASGVGKIIAASTDDVLSEVAELSALRGSGFTWRQLLKRSRILIPVFLLATYGAYAVEGFVRSHQYVTAGLLFGLSAVALSLTTAVQSVAMYKQCVDDMCAEGKLSVAAGSGRWRVAFHQDFSNPARLGLLIGAAMSPIMAITIFTLFPELTHNGWVLALLGTTETVVAGSTVMLARRINDARYARKIQDAARQI